jgi:hypothetical protein
MIKLEEWDVIYGYGCDSGRRYDGTFDGLSIVRKDCVCILVNNRQYVIKTNTARVLKNGKEFPISKVGDDYFYSPGPESNKNNAFLLSGSYDD